MITFQEGFDEKRTEPAAVDDLDVHGSASFASAHELQEGSTGSSAPVAEAQVAGCKLASMICATESVAVKDPEGTYPT